MCVCVCVSVCVSVCVCAMKCLPEEVSTINLFTVVNRGSLFVSTNYFKPCLIFVGQEPML
jgi:hypothetical protein